MIGIFSRNILKAYFIVYKLVFSGKLRIYPVFPSGKWRVGKALLFADAFRKWAGADGQGKRRSPEERGKGNSEGLRDKGEECLSTI